MQPGSAAWEQCRRRTRAQQALVFFGFESWDKGSAFCCSVGVTALHTRLDHTADLSSWSWG